MTTSPLRRNDGFTLIEVLVAISIAAIGFLGLAATHVSAVRATVLGRNVSLASGLAAEAIETMRRLPFDEVVSASPTSQTRDNVSFTRTATVAALGSGKKVTMAVGWTDQFGNHNVQLITVISQ